MKKLLIILAVLFMSLSGYSQNRENRFVVGGGLSYGGFTDNYASQIYKGCLAYRGLIGYEFSDVGLYGFFDYYSVTGTPIVEGSVGNYSNIGAKMEGASLGIEFRGYVSKNFYIGGEFGSASVKETMTIGDQSPYVTANGFMYAPVAGFQFDLFSGTTGEFEIIYSTSKIKSPAKEYETGNSTMSIGKFSVAFNILF
jgi:hypothetical protein